MKAFAVVSVWLFVFIRIALALPISIDLGSNISKSYKKFLQDIRNEVNDPQREYHGIPMMQKPPEVPTFLLADLMASPDITITVALNKSNLYLVAYRDRYQGKPRAHFFEDAPANAKTGPFSDAKGNLRKTIYYKTRYACITEKANKNRRSVGLGIQKLRYMVQDVYEREINEATQAQFLLVSVQMISEAARFKYIEGKVVNNFLVGFTPDYKVPSLEDNWDKISTAIFEANKEGKFNSPLELKDKGNQDWKVTEVKQIAPDVSLLLYIKV